MKFKEVVVCLCAEQKMQDMDERRIRRLAEGYCQFSDMEKKVMPIISKCLEGISAAGVKIDEKQVNVRCLLDYTCVYVCFCIYGHFVVFCFTHMIRIKGLWLCLSVLCYIYTSGLSVVKLGGMLVQGSKGIVRHVGKFASFLRDK